MAETLRNIDLPKIEDARGNLSFIEGDRHIPFPIRRAYWIYDVPGGEVRGSHAFRRQEEFIVALSGSFDVVLHDGVREQRIHLCRSYKGVYVPPMTWRTLDNFSTNSVGLVLSSTHYDEEDYIWDFEQFRREAAESSANSQNSGNAANSGSTEISKHTADTPTGRSTRLYTVDDCRVVDLPSITDSRRGCLTPLEGGGTDFPFDIRRIFYIYDIPSGAARGQHAHKENWEFIVAASSSFSIDLDDQHERRTVRLDRPYKGLLIPPGIWCHLRDFSSAAVALVITSERYIPEDNICDYDQLTEYRKQLL